MKKPERRLFVSVACAAALMVCGAVMMHLNKKPDEATFFAMDCPCTAAVYGGEAEAVKERIKALEKLYSPYEEGSELSRLNESGRLELSEETAQLIEKSIELTKKYGGADISAGALTARWNVTGEEPRVPEQSEIQTALSTVGYENIKLSGSECVLENGTQIDVGCDGKGFALDEVKKLLDSEKADCAVVSFGSSTLLYGQKPDKADFKVAVTDPFDNDNTCLSFTSGGGSVSTSGGYERYFKQDGKTYHHIIDPANGYPANNGLTSVTIVSDDGTLADGLSTSLFIMGPEKAQKYWKEHSDEFDTILVKDDGSILVSEGLAEYFTSESDFTIIKK